MRSNHIISISELQAALPAGNIRLLDATFLLPTMQRDAEAEFAAAHIPGAQFFDIDKIADETVDLPHMLPDASAFAASVRALGINSDSPIVVYDNSPFLSAARCWWMFRYFGHEDIRVLDGGLSGWIAAGGAVSSDVQTPITGNFQASQPKNVGHISYTELRAAIESDAAPQIIDARAAPRFEGSAPEPRAGISSGHMPGACNLPISTLLDENGFLRSDAEIKALFERLPVDYAQPLITSCGSGVTAAGLTLGLAILGIENVRLYDGSWSEWASHADSPIEKGPAV